MRGEVEVTNVTNVTKCKDGFKTDETLLCCMRNIIRNFEGSVAAYTDYEYDENGKLTKSTKYDADGNKI